MDPLNGLHIMTRILTFLAAYFIYSSSLFAQVATVAVATNMKDAFAEIAIAFRVASKSEMKVVYGSSGNFAAQIMNGAPFNLFIAADEHFPLELYKNGKTVDEGAVYAIGRLAMIVKNSSGVILVDSKAEIASAIKRANKIAIAKPKLAPYGKAVVEYLKVMGSG
uniref:Molybdenum ABC transporter, periplasmic molybdate-binding protein n=1 Tax=Polynucleobacter necessarius subsp. necessarius (strain STIR1) TaxID=452638 RepID=B1XU40_POLNS